MANTKTFEEDMARIEKIVELLEKGEAPLEESLTLFEEGTSLIKKCGKILDDAEKKINLLSAKEEGPEFSDFSGKEID